MKTITFTPEEFNDLAALLAAFQYHGVKFIVERDGQNICVTVK